jgi:hypothetical protein
MRPALSADKKMAVPEMRKNAENLTGINFETAPGVVVSNDKDMIA